MRAALHPGPDGDSIERERRVAFSEGLLADSYELTMAAGYFAQGRERDTAVFDLYFRQCPFDRATSGSWIRTIRCVAKNSMICDGRICGWMWFDGTRLFDFPSWDEVRMRRSDHLDCLDESCRRPYNPHESKVGLTSRLWRLKEQLMNEKAM
ncbi:MAG: hypothetical protein ABIG68_15045 [Acidobacteriota bacterium]